MKKAIVLPFILLALICYATPVLAGSWTGNVNVLLAKKSLDDDDWRGDLDEQNEFGLLFDLAQTNWPISIAVDLLGSKETDSISGVDWEGKTSELCLGVRKIFTIDRAGLFKPYIGGGLAFISSELEINGTSEDDSATGLWLNGGAYFTLSRHFNIGLDLRYSNAETTMFGNDYEAGGTHIGLLVGYHW